MDLKITILGCGNSSGVPAVGNYWGDCDPHEPKNRRSRCSLAVQSDKTTVIIDTGPDFRHQMNNYDINNLDAVFLTHQHSDHISGIDDLRTIYFRNGKTAVKCYGNKVTLDDVAGRFNYLFQGGVNKDLYPPILHALPFNEEMYGTPHMFSDIQYIPFQMDHGTCISVGYRFDDLSYCVDMKSLDDKALDIIKGSKIWIVDGCGYHRSDNAVHVDLETIYEYNKYIKAESVYITSLSTQMNYQTLVRELPKGFYPAYDGLCFDCID